MTLDLLIMSSNRIKKLHHRIWLNKLNAKELKATWKMIERKVKE